MPSFLRKFYLVCASLISMAFFISQGLAEEKPTSSPQPLRLEYKSWLFNSKNYPETRSVKYIGEKGVNTPGVILLSGKGSSASWLGFDIGIPADKLDGFKNKQLVFKIYVKRIKGEGTGAGNFTIVMRNWQILDKKYKLISASTRNFELKGNDWELLEFKGRIPEMAEINVNAVDFQAGTKNPLGAEYLVDEPALEAVSESNTSFESNYMAYADKKNSSPLFLIKEGKPAAAIVTAEKPTECVKYAVKELNEHLELCTGVKLPVVTENSKVEGTVIHIGKTKLTERFGIDPDMLSPDSWVVRRVNDAVLTSGGDNKQNLSPNSTYLAAFGTLYATYEFLERQLKVRWYWPGKLGTVAPKSKNILVENINWTGRPSYNTRFVFFDRPDDKDISDEEGRVWWRRMRRGSIGGSPIGMHSFNGWPDRFAKNHPEYFALQPDGSRMLNAAHGGGHVCFSNPDVLKQVISDKREEFNKTKWQMFSPVMPGDSDNLFYCRCPECAMLVKAGNGTATGMMSTRVWSFVNKVAAELRKTHPGKFITCCAYTVYFDAPDFSLEPNVAVTLCLGAPGYFFTTNEKNKYVDKIKKWQEKGATMYLWDYWCLPRFYKGVYGAPAVYPHALKEFYLLDYGRVSGHVLELTQFNSKGEDVNKWADWIYDSLNVYVAMRLLWNMDQDIDKVIEEFYTDFYGPAAPQIKKFYEEMEAAYLNPDTKGGPEFKWDWETCWMKTYPPAFVERNMGYLREAVKVTEGNEPYNSRARKTLEAYLPFETNSRMFKKAGTKAERNLSVPSVSKTPVIDGTLNGDCWKQAAKTVDFMDSFGLYDLKSKTEVVLVHDKDNLYIGINASFKKGSKLKLDIPENSRDGFVWDNESAEIFLTQDGKSYQFIIGPGNIFLDLYRSDMTKELKLDEAIKWNCEGISYKTVLGDDNWTAVISIPLKSLNIKLPTKENPWKVNFCRNHFYLLDQKTRTWKDELSAWSPTYGSFHNVERFGKLVFD